MADLIDREALLAESRKSFCSIHQLIKEAPRVDAEPVRHGRWEPVETEEEFGTVYEYRCNLCGKHDYFDTNYCPNCGAKMDKEV